jgi:hypothetical protein
MPESVEIELIYHGNNVFEVLQFKQLITDNEIQPFQFETCTEIPAFHSRSIEPEKTVFFEIELNDLQIGLPEFVGFVLYFFDKNNNINSILLYSSEY